MAEFIDFFLNPLSVTHPSYIKDTFDFIHKIRTIKIPTNWHLFTMDVKNLYTNIDVLEGIQAVTKVMGKNPDPNSDPNGDNPNTCN